jgi:hypothetical protein
MRLQEKAGTRDFSVFMRMHDEFNENFSIGLKHDPRDGSGEVILLRWNGPHGEYNNRFDASHPHAEYHVHRASEAAIRAGLRPESRAERTQAFASYREALVYFLNETNVVDAADYFPDSKQESLPFVEED